MVAGEKGEGEDGDDAAAVLLGLRAPLCRQRGRRRSEGVLRLLPRLSTAGDGGAGIQAGTRGLPMKATGGNKEEEIKNL